MGVFFLYARVLQLAAELSELQAENSSLASQNASLASENSSLALRNDSLSSQCSSLVSQLEGKEAESQLQAELCCQWQQQLSEAQQMCADMKKKCEELESEKQQEVEAVKRELLEEMAKQEEKFNKMRSEQAAADKERKEQVVFSEHWEKQCSDLQNLLTSAESAVEKEVKARHEMEEKYKCLLGERKNWEEQQVDLERRFEELRAKHLTVEEQLSLTEACAQEAHSKQVSRSVIVIAYCICVRHSFSGVLINLFFFLFGMTRTCVKTGCPRSL